MKLPEPVAWLIREPKWIGVQIENPNLTEPGYSKEALFTADDVLALVEWAMEQGPDLGGPDAPTHIFRAAYCKRDKMGDTGELWRAVKEERRERRRTLGVECPRCKEVRPKACPSILLPGQVCKVDKYRDPRCRACGGTGGDYTQISEGQHYGWKCQSCLGTGKARGTR